MYGDQGPGLNGLANQMFQKDRIMQAMAQARPGPGGFPAPGFMGGLQVPRAPGGISPVMPPMGAPMRAVPPMNSGVVGPAAAAGGMMGAAVMPNNGHNVRPGLATDPFTSYAAPEPRPMAPPQAPPMGPAGGPAHGFPAPGGISPTMPAPAPGMFQKPDPTKPMGAPAGSIPSTMPYSRRIL